MRRVMRDWGQQSPQCIWCGSADKLTIDHVVPISRGGSKGAVKNLQILCITCNWLKHHLTPEEFFAHVEKILARRGRVLLWKHEHEALLRAVKSKVGIWDIIKTWLKKKR